MSCNSPFFNSTSFLKPQSNKGRLISWKTKGNGKWWNCQVGHVSGHYVENSIERLVEYSQKEKLQFEIEVDEAVYLFILWRKSSINLIW